jgi:hypothetical protein
MTRRARGSAAILASTLLAAGCASGSTGSSDRPADVGPASASRMTSPGAIARELLDRAQVPGGATRAGQSPTSTLTDPPDQPSASGLIVRIHWWRVNESWNAVYAWISSHQSPGLSSIGSSSSSGPALTDRERAADFAMKGLPSNVNTAQLSIAVAPLTAHTSAIGAYAIVIPQPPRQHIEIVPLTVDQVTVITRRTSGEPDADQLLGRRVVTGAAAQRLVRDFDALEVQPPGEQFSCPMSFITQTAIFRSGSHVWAATSGVCIGIAVNLDGHALPTLSTSDAFSRDLRAAYGHRFPLITSPQPMNSAATQASVNL